MRSKFPGYYRPTDEQFEELWRNAIVSFDANVLLNLYEFTPTTRKLFFDVVEKLGDRIWLTHQAADEYHRHILGRIDDQLELYGGKDWFATLRTLEQQISKARQHPILEHDKLSAIVDTARNDLQQLINKQSAVDKYKADCNDIKIKIANLFDGKVGEQYKDKQLADIYTLCKKRLDADIPPGFKDKKKPEPQCFGDGLIWQQLLDFVRTNKRSLLFVTDDNKEDWWWIHHGLPEGPRPELVNEMLHLGTVRFYMYPSDQFMKYGSHYLGISTSVEQIEAAVSEVETMKKEPEKFLSFSINSNPAWQSFIARGFSPSTIFSDKARLYVNCPHCRQKKLAIEYGLLICSHCDYQADDPAEALIYNRQVPPFINVEESDASIVHGDCCGDQTVLEVWVPGGVGVGNCAIRTCFSCGERRRVNSDFL